MARGDATDESDIDLLVDFPPEGMGLGKVDIGREQNLNKHMREHALRYAVPLSQPSHKAQENGR